VQVLRQRQVRLSDERKVKLAAEYAAGGAIRQLATSWGVSREAVRSTLRQQHIAMRQVKLTTRQLADATELRTQGWSLNRLGALYGVDPKTMAKRLQEVARHETNPTPSMKGSSMVLPSGL
jgi:lambda repressor-like predicted transcriptional regulator